MSLNVSKGNMYDFITHTWNTIKGACPHGCGYCYMRRFGPQRVARFDQKELKTDLGSGNFIFVGSSNDLFCGLHPEEWVIDTLNYCSSFPQNKYLFQTKNPRILINYLDLVPMESVICTTIESNFYWNGHMGRTPTPAHRARAMVEISQHFETYVTIEPIMEFDLGELVELVKSFDPLQVNIGADSGGNDLPEPAPEKVQELIDTLRLHTVVKIKKNMKRILRNERQLQENQKS